jgi:hypothetical protein
MSSLHLLSSASRDLWLDRDREKDNERRRQEYERQEQTDAAEETARRVAARSAIALRDLALDEVRLKKGSPWTLTWNVTNNSKYDLGSLGFRVWVEACPVPGDWATPPPGVPPGPEKCITVGEVTVRANVSVPPGQMRAFSSSAVVFEGMPTTGYK